MSTYINPVVRIAAAASLTPFHTIEQFSALDDTDEMIASFDAITGHTIAKSSKALTIINNEAKLEASDDEEPMDTVRFLLKNIVAFNNRWHSSDWLVVATPSFKQAYYGLKKFKYDTLEVLETGNIVSEFNGFDVHWSVFTIIKNSFIDSINTSDDTVVFTKNISVDVTSFTNYFSPIKKKVELIYGPLATQLLMFAYNHLNVVKVNSSDCPDRYVPPGGMEWLNIEPQTRTFGSPKIDKFMLPLMVILNENGLLE